MQMLNVPTASPGWSDGGPGVLRFVEGRAFLFTAGLSEAFGVDLDAARGDARALERAARDLRELASHGYLTPARPRRSHCEVRLLLTTACNLACSYCNVSQGTYGEDSRHMSFETARAAIERLAPTGEPFSVVFFGGEPLLNWRVLVELTEWARASKMDARLVVITNGTLIDEAKARFFARHDVVVKVSVDGDEATHDLRRVDRVGRGSHARVVAGLEALERAGVRPTLLATHDPDRGDVGAQAAALHVLTRKRLPVIVSGLSDAHQAGFASQSRDQFARAAVAGEMPDALTYFLDSVIRGAHGSDLACPAGRDAVVSPSGDVFPCHIAADRKLDRIGALADDTSAFRAQREVVRERYEKPASKCDDCWANGLCSGGCPLRRSRGLGPTDQDCTWSQDRIEYAAYFADVLPIDRLIALLTAADGHRDVEASTPLCAGLMFREHFRGAGRAIWPLSIPRVAS